VPSNAPKQDVLFLGDLMRRELADGASRSRSEITRLKLLAAAADILQEQGYAELTVARIAKAAGFAHGTFYLHWADRTGIALEVIKALMEAIRKHRPVPATRIPFFDRLVLQHRFYISMYRQNSGLMQCQWQLADSDASFGQVALQANLALAKRVMKAVQAEVGTAPQSEPQMLAAALSCIAMVDKLLHDVCWRGLDLGLDDEALARNLSVTWYRALCGHEPLIQADPSTTNRARVARKGAGSTRVRSRAAQFNRSG
jgi:TetR/AcrR family transcriptional regulator, transcriptional repressor for nem operon